MWIIWEGGELKQITNHQTTKPNSNLKGDSRINFGKLHHAEPGGWGLRYFSVKMLKSLNIQILLLEGKGVICVD